MLHFLCMRKVLVEKAHTHALSYVSIIAICAYIDFTLFCASLSQIHLHDIKYGCLFYIIPTLSLSVSFDINEFAQEICRYSYIFVHLATSRRLPSRWITAASKRTFCRSLFCLSHFSPSLPHVIQCRLTALAPPSFLRLLPAARSPGFPSSAQRRGIPRLPSQIILEPAQEN